MTHDDTDTGDPQADRGLAHLARSLVGDEHVAEDVLQDSWIAARRRPTHGEASPGGWLRGIVRRIGLNRRSKRARERVEPLSEEGSRAPGPDELVAREQLLAEIRAAVDALAEPYHSAVRLRFLEEREYAEMAQLLGKPEGTLRTHVKRGLEQLRAALDRSHGGQREGWVPPLAGWIFDRDRTQSVERVAAVEAAGIGWLLFALRVCIPVTLLSLGLFYLLSERGTSSIHPGGDALALSSRRSTEQVDALVIDAPSAREKRVEAATLAVAPVAPVAPGASTVAPPVSDAASSVEVLVFDVQGRPVEGASVRVCAHDDRFVERAQTGADGRARIALADEDFREREHPNLSAAAQIWVHVAGDSAHYVYRVLPDAARHGVELRHCIEASGATLRLRFADSSGSGLANVLVRVGYEVRTQLPLSEGLFRCELSTLLDVEPRGVLEWRVPAGACHLEIAALEHARVILEERVEDGMMLERTIELSRGATIRGIVLGPDGRPRPGASIGSYGSWLLPQIETRADASGHFELRGVSSGRCLLWAYDSDKESLVAFQELVIDEGSTIDRNLELAGFVGLAGNFLDELGHPLGGYRVACRSDKPVFEAHGITDANGYWAHAAPPGRYGMTLSAPWPDDLIPAATFAGVPATEKTYTFTVKDSARSSAGVQVILRDWDGGPLPSGDILLVDLKTKFMADVPIEPRSGRVPKFACRPGRYTLLAQIGLRGVIDFGEFELSPEQLLDLGERRAPRPAVVRIEDAWPAEEGGETLWFNLSYYAQRSLLGDQADSAPFCTHNAAGKPLARYELYPGRHVLRIDRGGKRLQRRGFTVQAGEERRLEFGPNAKLLIPLRLARDVEPALERATVRVFERTDTTVTSTPIAELEVRANPASQVDVEVPVPEGDYLIEWTAADGVPHRFSVHAHEADLLRVSELRP